MSNLEDKLKSFFEEKNYAKIESEIEKIDNIENLNSKLQLSYATAKALNINSKKQDYKIAAYLFNKLYEKKKTNLEFLHNLIFTSVKASYFEYVEPHLLKEYQKNKNDPKILEGLGKMHYFYNEMDKASKYYEQLLKIRPYFLNTWSSYIASLNYDNKNDQNQYLKSAKKIDELPLPEIEKFKKNYKNEKIKIGFLSADLKAHSVSFFLKDTIQYLNKKDFEIHALSILSTNYYDEITTQFQSLFCKWHNVSHLKDIELIRFLRSIQLDILIDLSGHTYNNRINCLRSRCAPIQLTWLGYCNTLGIKNIDYIIADPYLIKKNEESLYLEKVLYMPKIWSSYSKPKNIPKILDNRIFIKEFTFGSFNNFKKISDLTIKVWSKILNNGNSKLILKNSVGINENRSNEILINKFRKEKVDINKLIILDTKTTIKEHLECYNKIDLALDTFPYPGVTTTFESIMMGVPVLTMKGFNFNSRCGESINNNLGLNELIANNENDYFDKAFKFQNEKETLINLKSKLKKKSSNSPLFDTKTFANQFSKLIMSLT